MSVIITFLNIGTLIFHVFCHIPTTPSEGQVGTRAEVKGKASLSTSL
jgi:hypothetical protein